MMSLTLAIMTHVVDVEIRASKSLARRRFRLSHAMVRSTTQRRGSRTNPLAVSGTQVNSDLNKLGGALGQPVLGDTDVVLKSGAHAVGAAFQDPPHHLVLEAADARRRPGGSWHDALQLG